MIRIQLKIFSRTYYEWYCSDRSKKFNKKSKNDEPLETSKLPKKLNSKNMEEGYNSRQKIIIFQNKIKQYFGYTEGRKVKRLKQDTEDRDK